MNLKELEEAEDDFDEADREAIEKYRYSKILHSRLRMHVSLSYMYMLLKNKLKIFKQSCLLTDISAFHCQQKDSTHIAILFLPDYLWQREAVTPYFTLLLC